MSEAPTKAAGYRCRSCDTPFRAQTPYNCSVEIWASFATNLTCPTCGADTVDIGLNLSKAENAALICPGPEKVRARNWLDVGEPGLSSKAIYGFFMKDASYGTSTPSDPSDLRRCIFLLEHVPEWAPRMQEMKGLSPQWTALLEVWDDIVRLYHEEVADGGGQAPRTYKALRALAAGEG